MEFKGCLEVAGLTEEWMESNEIEGCYDFKNLQLSISRPRWLDVFVLSDPSRPKRCGTVSWNFSGHQNPSPLCIAATVKREPECTVRLRSGFLKHGNTDFDAKVKLSFEGLPNYIRKYLSMNSIIIDLGSEVPTESDPQPTPCQNYETFSSEEMSQSLGATVSVASGRYIVFFSLRAALNGDVKIIEKDGSVQQENIMELVNSLSDSDKRMMISVSDAGCEWRVTGECEFNFECSSTIESDPKSAC
ncbi:unnamed protein product [Lymnaea stagnalis]|uniref:Uncharacterized protein n=1 Tax=Lymnaea stagnalis TaxID=6523 RepID=A0AAV2HNX4_LYMST